MGFLDELGKDAASGAADKLDLVEYEKNLLAKFNDPENLGMKYKAESLGMTYDKKAKALDIYLYDGSETITLCPEPLSFIREFDDVSDNATKANALFLEKKNAFKTMRLEQRPELRAGTSFGDRMWMNKTASGINLRPGNLNDDPEDFTPVKMCDDNVHGLIVGRTGSGKSVFINALILSLITEYPPWELDLYLADFKKVELSRYMNDADEANRYTAFTPHVNACAATGEIRYVISMIRYLVDCMNARQELFARLGVTKIQEFRKKYGVVLPRVLLMVDEFQQLFTEATSREAEELQTLLNAITKLGRATGFHLIFASQEMSGTLQSNTLSNFKIRMALPCEAQVSSDILGNAQAVKLTRGFVLVNTESGDELKNMKYRVPFIETDKKDDDEDETKSPFYAFLDEFKLAGLQFDLSDKAAVQKFYREELQETEREYLGDLDRISEGKNRMIRRASALFDAVVLGKTVVYSPKRNDKATFYIEKGRNKGIMIATPNADDAARIRKLLAENILRSDCRTDHYGIELNDLVHERYRMEEYLPQHPGHRYFSCDVDKAFLYPIAIYSMRLTASRQMAQNGAETAQQYKTEQQLTGRLAQPEQAAQYRAYVAERQNLQQEIRQLEEEIRRKKAEKTAGTGNPLQSYLEECSDLLVKIPQFGKETALTSLSRFDAVCALFEGEPDVHKAAEKAAEILEQDMEKAQASGAAKEQVDLLLLRLKLLRRAVLFYDQVYGGQEPERTSFNPYMQKAYGAVAAEVEEFRSAMQMNLALQEAVEQLDAECQDKQRTLRRLEKNPDETYALLERLQEGAQRFMRPVFEQAVSVMKYPRDESRMPRVLLKADDTGLHWSLEPGMLEEKLTNIAEDILRLYRDFWQKKTTDKTAFSKVVVWINGLDEAERTPRQLEETIRNALNQNILIVAIVLSELQDSGFWKAFDYGFVTGNVEKFYDKLDIRYTKQPMDSIVVNFGIRSKGMELPFKIYKSRLEEIQAPDFVEQLLNQ